MPVKVLLVGTLLAPGKRSVTSALRAIGLADAPGFSKYHQVLNRAVWSSRRASQMTPVPNTIRLVRNGPLYVRGDFTIVNSMGEIVAHETRASCAAVDLPPISPFVTVLTPESALLPSNGRWLAQVTRYGSVAHQSGQAYAVWPLSSLQRVMHPHR